MARALLFENIVLSSESQIKPQCHLFHWSCQWQSQLPPVLGASCDWSQSSSGFGILQVHCSGLEKVVSQWPGSFKLSVGLQKTLPSTTFSLAQEISHKTRFLLAFLHLHSPSPPSGNTELGSAEQGTQFAWARFRTFQLSFLGWHTACAFVKRFRKLQEKVQILKPLLGLIRIYRLTPLAGTPRAAPPITWVVSSPSQKTRKKKSQDHPDQPLKDQPVKGRQSSTSPALKFAGVAKRVSWAVPIFCCYFRHRWRRGTFG